RAEARERRAGMSGYALRYHRSMGGSDVVSLKMDYLGMYYGKNFLTGFYEVWSEIGGSVPDALFHYSLGMKLGLGVGSRIFSFFIASGIMVDSYKSTKSKSRDDHVAPGAGVPLTFGVWLNPTYDIAVYAMAEPSWAFGAKDRATTPFSPFSFARELRLRGGVSYALGDSWHGLKLRLDYTFHQVNPHDWHIVTLGIGY
ncbi:MAG: hypothetical protein FWC40_08730, partial [Proteobacteria bacterium]|nr:hypothetical protein [Pseudomonadota bacterium]